MKTIENIAKTVVFILSIACAMVPFIVWLMNPSLTQMEVFLNTWVWLFYSVIIYLLGFTFVNGIFNRN